MQGTKRPARFVQQSNVVGRVRNGPKVTSNGRPLKSARVVKITHKNGGFTVVATPGSRIGDSGVIDGIRYVIRTKSQLKDLIAKRRWRDVEQTCTSKITDMSLLFRDAFDFNGNISHWDVGNVWDMHGMFYRATLFNGDISRWDVSRVEDMSKMFWGATSFNGDISRWDVRKVTDMYDMFGNTPSFKRSILAWKARLHGRLSFDNETMARILRGGRRPPGIKYKTRSGVEVRIRKYRGKDNMYRAWSILRGFYMPDCIKPRFADPTWTVFIAMGRGDEIYGALWLVEKKDTVYIKSLSVADDAKRMGIGHLMIARAVRHAREVRKRVIELESLTTPETLKFYNRLGFVRGPPQLRQRALKERWTMFTPVMNDVNGMDMDLPKAHLRTRNFNGSRTGPVRKTRDVQKKRGRSNSKKRSPEVRIESNNRQKKSRLVHSPIRTSAKRHKGLV